MEITENTSNQLERAAQLGRLRTVQSYPILGNRSGLFRSQSESIGTGIIVDPDGDEIEQEYFGPQTGISVTGLKARRY